MPVPSIYPTEKPLDVYSLNKTEGNIALEMEVEGDNLPSIRTKMWQTHGDGSLRLNGMEYVNNGPLPKDKVLESLLNWESRMVKSQAIVYETDRTSVHVHMNMQDKTFKQIAQGCVAYFILENALMRHCGPSRQNNLFCLPLKQSKAQLNALKYVSGSFEGVAIRTDTYRYSALNLMALMKFGSIEHRGMRGYYAPEFLNQWALNLNNIFDVAAKDFKSPVEVLDHFYGRSFREYAGTFLTPDMVDTLSKIKDWDIDKDENLPILGPIIYNTDFDKKRPERSKIEKRVENTIPHWRDLAYTATNIDTTTRILRGNMPRKGRVPNIFGYPLSDAEFRTIQEVRNAYFEWMDAKISFENGDSYHDWDTDEEIAYQDPGERPSNTNGYGFFLFGDIRVDTYEDNLIEFFGYRYPVDYVANWRARGANLFEHVREYLAGITITPDNKYILTDWQNNKRMDTLEEVMKDFLVTMNHEADYQVRLENWRREGQETMNTVPNPFEEIQLRNELDRIAQEFTTTRPTTTANTVHWSGFNPDEDDDE